MVITVQQFEKFFYHQTDVTEDAFYNQIASTLPEELGPLIDGTLDNGNRRTAVHVATSFDAQLRF